VEKFGFLLASLVGGLGSHETAACRHLGKQNRLSLSQCSMTLQVSEPLIKVRFCALMVESLTTLGATTISCSQ
jgi:hypothetical protein